MTLNLEPIAFADYLWDRIGTTGTVFALAATYLVGFGISFLMKVGQGALAAAEREQLVSATAK